MTHTHTHACTALCVWGVKCLVCVNVPSVCSQCQALMTGAPEIVCACPLVCVKVCSLESTTPDSDRLRPSVESSRLRRVFSTHSTDRTHTHAVVCSGCQCGLQPIITPCRESQANQTRLALPRTLRVERLDLHKSSELLHKCFLWGNPFHSSQRSQVKAATLKLEGAPRLRSYPDS